MFRLRFRDLKLSQRAFAERFGLPYSVVRDAEQGAKPSRALQVLVAAIACNPDLIEAAGRLAATPCRCSEGDAYRCCALDELPEGGNFATQTRARTRCFPKGRSWAGSTDTVSKQLTGGAIRILTLLNRKGSKMEPYSHPIRHQHDSLPHLFRKN